MPSSLKFTSMEDIAVVEVAHDIATHKDYRGTSNPWQMIADKIAVVQNNMHKSSHVRNQCQRLTGHIWDRDASAMLSAFGQWAKPIREGIAISMVPRGSVPTSDDLESIKAKVNATHVRLGHNVKHIFTAEDYPLPSLNRRCKRDKDDQRDHVKASVTGQPRIHTVVSQGRGPNCSFTKTKDQGADVSDKSGGEPPTVDQLIKDADEQNRDDARVRREVAERVDMEWREQGWDQCFTDLMTPANATGQQRVRAERNESGDPTAVRDRRMHLPPKPSMRYSDAELEKGKPNQSGAGTGQSESLVVRAAGLRSKLDELEHGHGRGDWEAEWAVDEERAAEESISKLHTLLSMEPPAKAMQIADWVVRVAGPTEDDTEPWVEQVYKHARAPEHRVDKDLLLKRAVTVERVVSMRHREREEGEGLSQEEPTQSGGSEEPAPSGPTHADKLRAKLKKMQKKARTGQRGRDVQKLRVELDAATRSSDAKLVVSVLQRPNITLLISDAVGWATTEIDRESVSADEESQEWAARLDFWMAVLDLLEGRVPQAPTPCKPTKPVPMVTGYRESKKRTMEQLVSICLTVSICLLSLFACLSLFA